MTISISPEVEAQLKNEAQKRGIDANVYAEELIKRGLSRGVDKTLELFRQWEEEDRTDDPEEIARRQKEFEEFKEAMNRNRLESEGPNARKLFP